MSREPLVSVVIPTYNCAAYIAQAVQSVLDQTYKNIEVIVVDDGSTDNTRLVLEPFMGKIRYILTENRRAAHARNVGMKAASGKYIACLDSDDLYLPSKVALQVAFMEAHPEVGILSTEVSSIIGKTITEECHLRSYHQIFERKGWSYGDIYPVQGQFRCEAVAEEVPYFIGNVFRHLLHGPVLMQNTVLFKREILEHVGYHDENYSHATEYELIVRICRDYQAAFLNIPTYLYRYHENQMSMIGSTMSREKILTQITIENDFLHAVLDWGYGDKKYYEENKGWLNHRIAELYHCIGEQWLEIGESGKARENFRKGHGFDPSWTPNMKNLRFSYLPSIMRRAIIGVSRRVKITK